MGWRYIGARLFLVEDADAYRKAWAAHEAEQSDRPFRLLDPRSDMLSAASVAALGETPKALASYGPSDVVTIFKHNGALYTASAPHHDLAHPTSASLLRLSNDRKPETVCSIDLLPSIDSVEAFIAQSAFFHAMKPIYGVPQYRCRGTMGWTADPLELPLLTLFHRPHAMAAAFERRPVIATAKADAAREVRFLAWGLDDPTSWSIYEAYKASRAGFIQQMTAYYRHFFTSSDDEAKRLAEQGYRFLADRLIYNHSSDPFHLTAVIDDAHGPFNITGESAPKDIAAAAIDALLALSPEPETGKPLSDDGLWDYSIWHDAVLAATYTRQGAERVRQLLERLEQAISQAGFRRPKDKRMENLNELFLAALGDGPLMELALSLGADVNAPTNWFQKTPLMYAAQRNDLPTTQFLLSEGADPSARTSVDRNECYQLERDGRTPLIYAAENASPGLIELLLEAGADSGAVDSMGNSVLWYLERNEQLTTDERQSLNTRLGSHH
ncbi:MULTISPECIES: ankyrin repeat domain-containing protein [unclassified Iodidimonas]|uniref:ankyrin repeat domain-containing protein n=1 Tax=unclassified Iodidimonas TaxID=2626145 RepID=UPI002482CBDE|nr:MULTISPECIES: ankyrin repeat domain-containing protein [unclassified Iodidimonas]